MKIYILIPLYHDDANVDSTYHSTSVNAFSIIDHIFVSKSLSMYITDYVSLSEEIDNQSDHSPVLLTMSIDIILHSNVSQVRKPRKKWNQVNSNILCSYHTELNKCLSKIVVPNDMLYCRNMSCQCDTHVNDIHRLHDDIISSIMEASEVIPSTTTKTSKNIPGWDTSVSYKKEIALFWSSIWISMNTPRDGHVADIMRRTRAQYHYTIRKTKRSNDLLTPERPGIEILIKKHFL